MENMFRMNKIPIKMENIIDLFNKSKLNSSDKISIKNFKYLEFSDLVTFAISNSTEDKYRNFMRNFKKTNLISNETFIPMNFPSLLEHFHTKGLVRDNVQQVKSAMNKMDKMTNHIKSQLNFPVEALKTDSNGQIDNNIDKQINIDKIYSNFTNVVNLSRKHIDKIVKKNIIINDNKFPSSRLN